MDAVVQGTFDFAGLDRASTARLLLEGGRRMEEDTFLRLVALTTTLFVVARIVTALTCTWMFKHLSSRDQSEGLGRIVSTFHSLISTVLALLAIAATDFRFTELATEDALWREIRGPQALAMVITGGYFLYDMLHDFAFNFPRDLTGLSMVVHHIVSLLTYMFTLCASPATGVIVAVSLQTMEITTPLFNLRWILLKENMGHGIVFTIVNNLFTVGFLVFRVLFGAFIGYFMIYMPTDGLVTLEITRALGYVFISLQFMWFNGLIKSILRNKARKAKLAKSN